MLPCLLFVRPICILLCLPLHSICLGVLILKINFFFSGFKEKLLIFADGDVFLVGYRLAWQDSNFK